MKILITGTKGVVGTKLEKKLLAQGNEVFGVDLRHTDSVYGHGLGKVENENYFRCDIAEYRQISDVINHVNPISFIIVLRNLEDGMGNIFTKKFGSQMPLA